MLKNFILGVFQMIGMLFERSKCFGTLSVVVKNEVFLAMDLVEEKAMGIHKVIGEL